MKPAPLNLTGSFVWFAVPSIALILLTRYAIPEMVHNGIHGLFAWFVSAFLLMGTMFLIAIRSAKGQPVKTALKVKRLTGNDLRIAIIVLAASGVLMGILYFSMNLLVGPSQSMMPPFLDGTVIDPSHRLVYLLSWLPMFFFNIAGEELLWRGVLLPRQEAFFGKKAWVLNGALWMMFHISFGLRMMIILLPVFFALPWLVQKTGNTSTDILFHGLINGPAFAAILLGLL